MFHFCTMHDKPHHCKMHLLSDNTNNDDNKNNAINNTHLHKNATNTYYRTISTRSVHYA